ncbi:MAG TPA: UbiA family prenyltransferase [Candidatus Thalassarchaeaceae archaeon]|nr:UbiA family prenyltransferase [Candidatus Thalassarchaeaceae archaeon]
MSRGSILASWGLLFRAGNSVTGIFGVFLGAILATRGLPTGVDAAITSLHAFSVMAFMFSWNALNDVLDIDIDRVNHPNRPLPSGRISITAAKTGVTVTGLLSLISIFSAGYIASYGGMGLDSWLPAPIIWLVALSLLVNYESSHSVFLGLKDRGFSGNIAISLSVGLVIIFGAAGVSDPFDRRAISVFLIGFLYNLAREIVKDIEDMGGDRGRTTLAMSAGPEKARMVSWLILMATLVALLLPFAPVLEIFTDWHVIFMIPAVVSLLMVKPRLFSSEDHSAQMMIKRSMQLGLASFVVISLMPV